MKIKEHIEQATAEFKQRRLDWRQLAAYDIETLELIEHQSLTIAQRETLVEYLRVRKRERKAELEVLEKRADYLERAALPVAVTFFSVAAWFLTELQAPDAWRRAIQVLAFIVAVGAWQGIRAFAFRQIVEARKSLARLGRVD